jgi:hypothetical protein
MSDASPEPATAPPAPAEPAGSLAGSLEPGELDELARRLYGRIRVHLQQELRHDRERLGLLINRR